MTAGTLEIAEDLAAPHSQGTLGRIWGATSRIVRQPLAIPAIAVVLIVVAAALLSPLVAPNDPLTQDPYATLGSPSVQHWLGTDELGRDVLSRLIYGSQIALIVGLGAVAIGVAIGLPLGLISGYLGGIVDDVIMRIIDALVAFPGLILTLALVAALGRNLHNLVLAIGIANVPWIARIVRAQVLSSRELDYIVAARSIGAGHARIMARHIMPNTLAPVIVQSTLGMGYAVLTEASLSFIGAGISPPTPTWGSMLQKAFGFLNRDPMLSIVPGVAIFLLVLSFNVLGDILRDVLDPRMRGAVR